MSSSDLSGYNTNDGDGCSSLCAIESNYICNGDPTSSSDSCFACPAGLSPDATKTSCVATCGDSKRASSGTCDDGDTTSGDGCSSSCAIDGDYYIGYYKEGSRNGEGTCYKTNGDKYTGIWDDWKCQGEINFTDGTKYCHGTYDTKNGDKYTGQWDGNYEGQEEINYKDGTKYKGYWDWKDGDFKRNGQVNSILCRRTSTQRRQVGQRQV